MSDSKFTYKIVEESPDGHLFNVIEKTGGAVRFTLQEIESNVLTNEKHLKEFKGKLQIEQAKKQNIEEHHPFVKDLTPEQRITVYMYEESLAFERVLLPKIEELEESLKELREAKEDIERQVGIAIPKSAVEETPEESNVIDLN